MDLLQRELKKNPLIECIDKTEVLSDVNKNILYKELKLSGLASIQNIFKKNIELPSQENEIKELFEKVLVYNDIGVNALIKEYQMIKSGNSI